MSYDNPWIYEEKIFDSDQIQDYYGFVYHIRNNINTRCYIGRKYLWQFRTPKVNNAFEKEKQNNSTFKKIKTYLAKPNASGETTLRSYQATK